MRTLFKNGYIYTYEKQMFEKADILVSGTVIEKIDDSICPCEADEVIDCAGKRIIPGLVDIHSHGRGGFDFNTVDAETIKKARRSYAEVGTTTVMATLASAELDELINSEKIITDNLEPEEGLANIAGIHIEGRYLNMKRRGAHNEKLIFPLDPDELEKLVTLDKPANIHISSAFELDADGKFLAKALDMGLSCSLAHSDATYAEACSLVERGLKAFTHTYNCMKPVHHREPGNIIASLLCDDAYSEFICDGEHSHPAMIELAYRTKPKDKLVLITDSCEAAGCPDGNYSIAGLPVIVENGRAVTIEGALAGSTLDLLTAIKNFIRFTKAPLEEVIPMATANPAALVGLSDVCGEIKCGLRADLVILPEDELTVDSVWIAGKKA